LNHLEVEGEIRKYIREHPGTTINQVAIHLAEKKLASYVPAYNKIKYLIQVGIIEDLREGNSLHRLYINDENDYNMISEELTNIEKILSRMHKPIKKISELYGRYGRNKANEFKKDYQWFFMWAFHVLLIRTAHVNQSQRQSQELLNKIVKLMLELNDQFTEYDNENYTEGVVSLFSDNVHPSVKKFGIDENSINELRQLTYDINSIVDDDALEARNKANEQRRRQI
jgi:hypothetical protein